MYASVCPGECVTSKEPITPYFRVTGTNGTDHALEFRAEWDATSPLNAEFRFFIHPKGDGFDVLWESAGKSPVLGELTLAAGGEYRVGVTSSGAAQGGPPQTIDVFVKGPLVPRDE